MKNRYISLLLVGILLVAGCTASDLNSLTKAAPMINTFLAQYPNAELTTSFLSESSLSSKLAEIKSDCPDFPVSSYYKAVLSDKDSGMNVVVWLDSKTFTISCAIARRGGEKIQLSGIPLVAPETAKPELIVPFSTTTTMDDRYITITTMKPADELTNPAAEFFRTNSKNDGGRVGVWQPICEIPAASGIVNGDFEGASSKLFKDGKCMVAPLDISNAKSILIKGKVKVIQNTLEGSGWWSDYHNGEGEYPARFYLSYSLDGAKEDGSWTWGFLPKKNVDKLTNYNQVEKDKWSEFVSVNIADYFNSLSNKPKYLSRLMLAGNGWDYRSRMDDVRLIIDGKEYPLVNPDFSDKLNGWEIDHGSNVQDKYEANVVNDNSETIGEKIPTPTFGWTFYGENNGIAKIMLQGTSFTSATDSTKLVFPSTNHALNLRSDAPGRIISKGIALSDPFVLSGDFIEWTNLFERRNYNLLFELLDADTNDVLLAKTISADSDVWQDKKTDWATSKIDVSNFKGKKVSVKFSGNTLDGGWGWYVLIDNVKVSGIPSVTTTTTPTTTTTISNVTTSTTTTTSAGLPDLNAKSVGNFQGSFFSTYLNFSVTNSGTGSAGAFDVNVTISNSSDSYVNQNINPSGIWYKGTTRINSLAAGETIYISFNVTNATKVNWDGSLPSYFNPEAGINFREVKNQYYVNITADNLNEISESNENNNMNSTYILWNITNTCITHSAPFQGCKYVISWQYLQFVGSTSNPTG